MRLGVMGGQSQMHSLLLINRDVGDIGDVSWAFNMCQQEISALGLGCRGTLM